MRTIDTISAEYEVSIGDLLCVCTGSIKYDHFYRASNGIEPPEESLNVLSSHFESAHYYIDGEEAGLSEAVKYYKDYTFIKYEEILPVTLKELCQIHCDTIAEGAAEDHIQNND